LNQNLTNPPTQQQPSLSIVLPFFSTPPHSLSSTSAHTFSHATPTSTTKSPAKRPSSHSKKPSLPRNTLFPPHLLKPQKPPPPGYDPSLIKKKKRERLSGELLPFKKHSSSSSLPAANPDELEASIPMDATPSSPQQIAARPLIKVSRKKKQVSPSVSISATDEHVTLATIISGDQLVSPRAT
jgi:hypothetical protein